MAQGDLTTTSSESDGKKIRVNLHAISLLTTLFSVPMLIGIGGGLAMLTFFVGGVLFVIGFIRQERGPFTVLAAIALLLPLLFLVAAIFGLISSR